MAGAEAESMSRAEFATFATFVATFSVPSLLLNLNVAHTVAADWAQVSLAIGSVLCCPLALHALITLYQQRNYAVALGVAILFVASALFNLTTALGNVAMSRATVAEGRTTVAKTVGRSEERRLTVARQLDKVRELSQGLSPELAAQQLATSESNALYKRSESCRKPTLQDSIDFCAIHAGIETRHLAAKEAARLDIELAAIDLALDGKGAAPTDADPQVANTAALANLFFPVDERLVTVLLNARSAIMAELLGALSPLMFIPFSHLFRRKRAVVQVVEAVVPQHEPERPAIERFIAECVRRAAGAEVKGADLYLAYQSFCAAAGE